MRPVRRLLGRVFLVTALLALGLVAVPAVTTLADPATGVSYSYDAAGHLASVTTVDGSAVYHYDADGNITSIERFASGELHVFQFSPQSGQVGDPVTIHGSGFSTIPSNDIVKFDGTQATVSSATPTQLQVTVPSGATTGTISVMVGANTATSADTFTVHGDLSPSITDVTGPSPTYPHVVNYGDRILIQGTNLCSADLKQCNVSIDDTSARAVITPPGPVGLSALVPDVFSSGDGGPSPFVVGSGPVTVSTPYGSDTSPNDLYVLPPHWSTSDITSGGYTSMSIGTSKQITVAGGKRAMVLFDGTQGERVSLQVDPQTTTADSVFSILGPHRYLVPGNIDQPPHVQGSSVLFGPLTLPNTGTYTILIESQSGSPLTDDLTLTGVAPDVSGKIAIGGPPVTVTTTTPGQNAALKFKGTGGRRFSLKTSNSNLTGTVSVITPNQWKLVDSVPFGAGAGVPISGRKLPRTGTYTLVVDPDGAQYGHVSLKLVKGTAATAALATAAAGGTALVPSTSSPSLPVGFNAGPEAWVPTAADRRGDWTTHREPSPWASLPALRAPPGRRALAGQALRLNGLPLAGVTVSFEGHKAKTDATGRFLLRNVPSGYHALSIDGRTADRPGARYGQFEVRTYVYPGQTTVLPYTVWMPKIDWADGVTVSSPTTSRLVLTNPSIPGLKVIIPPGTVIRDDDGDLVHRVSITPVPIDRPPFPLPQMGESPSAVYYTIQPGGAYVHGPGVRIIYPNYAGLHAGMRGVFWHYDPDHREWYQYGHGAVAPGARRIVPDPGVRVWEFTGYMYHTEPPNNGPKPCSCEGEGDPVDPRTGLLVHSHTDLAEPDVIPATLTRVYRPEDTNSTRPFGVGNAPSIENYLNFVSKDDTDLLFADGGRIHYRRVSRQDMAPDAVYEAVTTPSIFYHSFIKWNDQLQMWELSLHDGTVYRFPPTEPMVAIADRFQNELTISRTDGSYFIQSITSPNGRWIHPTYFPSGAHYEQIASATDVLGRTVSYGYDNALRLTRSTDANGGVTHYSYTGPAASDKTLLLSITDPRGVVALRNQYKHGRVVTQTHADGGTHKFSYTRKHGRPTRTTETDPRGTHDVVFFNRAGYVVKEVRDAGTPDAQTERIARDPGSEFPTRFTDQLGRVTTLGYDGNGDVTRITRLAGTPQAVSTRFQYFLKYGLVTEIRDPMGHKTTFTYDARGAQRSVANASGQTWFSTHDPEGEVTSVTDPLGKTTTYQYELGQQVGAADPLGDTTSTFFDPGGRPTTATDPSGRTSLIAYDALNHVTTTTDPLGNTTHFTYDADGNVTQLTDQRGNATKYAYNSMDQVTKRTDPLGRLTRFGWDSIGDRTRLIRPDGKLDAFTYDRLGRLTDVGYGKGTKGGFPRSDSFGWDGANRLVRATDSATGTVHLAYDGLDRMRSMTSPQGAVSYRYDDAGRRTRMETGRGNVVNYQYTAAGRLVRISSGQDTVSFSYDPDGRMTSMALPNGVTTSVHYDARSRPDAMQYAKGGSSLGDLTYSYDANGERVTVGGSFARATLPDQVSSATYNKDNELTNWGPSHLTYNADGELTNDGTFSYGWNARGELASTSGSGQSESFSYDALDRRVQRTHGGTTTSYLYDGANPIRESSKSGGVSLLTGLGTDQFLARRGTGGTRYFLPDGLGSTVALADPAGSLSTQYTYDPHGDSTASSPSPNEVRFAGRERDPSGLYYDRARYYSPRFDRFISSDPIGFAGGSTNTYAYAGGDPVNVRDVSGLSFSDTIRDGASAVVGELGGLWSAVSGAIECAANSAWNWVKDQFSNETTRPYAIAISVLLAALVVVATWPLALTIVQVVGTELFGAGEPEWVELAAQRGAFPEGEVEFAPTSPFGTIPAEPPIGDTAVTGTGVVPAEPPIADPPAIGTGVIPTDPPIPTGGPGIRPAFVVNPIDVSSWARTLSLMGW